MVRDGRLVNEPGYITNVITEDALAYLDSCPGQDRPFYLSVHYTAPHSPWTGHPQDIVDSYDDCPFESCPQEPRHPWAIWLTDENLGNRESLKGYFAAVTAMDADVGRIVDRVEELGLRENTLIIFGGDNGFSCGHHGFWGKGNGTFPLNMYENSVKVPLIFSHPGRLPQGAVTDVLASGYDFAPSLLDYLGLSWPGEGLPGRSFVPALMGHGDGGHEHVVVHTEYGPTRMVRTREWKYVHRYPYGPHDLYHLTEDPDERVNLAEDPAYAGTVREMRERLGEWFHRYADPAQDGRALPVTGSGQVGLTGPGRGESAFPPEEG
jgi:arylsulfatase A-like enzyme